jgi:hypothetical protein
MSIVANNHSLDRTEFACNCNVVTGDVVTTSSETAKEGGRWVVSGRKFREEPTRVCGELPNYQPGTFIVCWASW